MPRVKAAGPGGSALSPETCTYRDIYHSGEDRFTAAEQRSGLPDRSEKQKDECHDEQHIDAGRGKETCYYIALKDSLEVSGTHGPFRCGLTRGHTSSSLGQ
jgi:hypothetical protein